MADYPKYKFVIKEDGTNSGMLGISLVDQPAVESSFVLFNNSGNVKGRYIALEDEEGNYKQEVLGAALRPDFEILRKDPNTGKMYVGIFEKETIEEIRNKFHKQKFTDNVNLDHNQDLSIDAYLIESQIIQTETQLKAYQEMGLEDIEIGAWIVRYKVESEELFKKIVNGEYDLHGFSIEAYLNLEAFNALQINNNNNQNNKSIMSKFKDLIDKFKTVINEFEDEEPKLEFEDVIVAESGEVLRYTEVGSPVLVVTTDDEGAETESAAAEGEYVLEDNRVLVVDADGNLVEIKEGEAPVEDEPVSGSTESNSTETNLAGEGETTTEGETTSDLTKTLSELIPTDSDGTYQLEVYVSDGKISLGTLYAYTYKDLKLEKLIEDFEALKTEKIELSKKIEELEEEPVVKQSFSGKIDKLEINEKKTAKDFKTNYEYQIYKLGIQEED